MQAARASSGERWSCVQASEQTIGRLSQNELPGLKSVASAIAAPASASARAGGIGRSRKSALTGSSTADHLACRERPNASWPRRLEVVDRARAELDRQRHRASLGELVGVQAQREARVAAGLEVTPGLRRLEGAFLDEDVRRRGEPRGFREHLGQDEVEIRVGVAKLRRHRVRAEPRRDTALRRDRAQRRELGLAVEPVAGFRTRTSSSRRAASNRGAGSRRS